MKSQILTYAVLALTVCNAGAALYDLSNEQLAKDFGTGKNVGLFERELKSAEATKWIERCLKDATLK